MRWGWPNRPLDRLGQQTLAHTPHQMYQNEGGREEGTRLETFKYLKVSKRCSVCSFREGRSCSSFFFDTFLRSKFPKMVKKAPRTRLETFKYLKVSRQCPVGRVLKVPFCCFFTFFTFLREKSVSKRYFCIENAGENTCGRWNGEIRRH